MAHPTALALFQSSQTAQVVHDSANSAWVELLSSLTGPLWEEAGRRYHVALSHFRQNKRRPATADHHIEIEVNERGEAKQVLLHEVYSGGPSQVAMFVPVGLPSRESDTELPACLRDFSVRPPPLSWSCRGPGRPAVDGLCLMRATLGAIAMKLPDDPSSLFQLLRSNPAFAELCGFSGAGTKKEAGEWTTRSLPSESTLEEFDAVMTRYGLWHHEQLAQVLRNIASGAVALNDTLSFDTTHIEAASACSSITPPPTEKTPAPKGRKVGHVTKTCDCGKERWQGCPHPWRQTDQGAAIVVKGPTKKHWAHKVSVVTSGARDQPLSARVCSYAATADGKTLPPHLDELAQEIPAAVERARVVLGDAAYRGNKEAVHKHELDLIVGITGKKTRPTLAESYPGVDHFTPSGVPICDGGHAFIFRGRDIKQERFIWQAPAGDDGAPVCAGCPLAAACLTKGSKRRHLRVHRKDFRQIDWDLPQHQARHQITYAQRTGVERSIKRIKNDLGGAVLNRRGASRVQAHIDRRMLVLHLLYAIAIT